MVGPCGKILPQWLRAPCNGVSKTDIVVGKVQCVCVCVCVCVPEAHSMQMVGPWGRYLPQWLRAPCKGSGPARSTQHADGRTLG